MSKNSFYSKEDLQKVGFARCGNNVLISRNAQFYSPENIYIGNNVRIDDFCILSAGGTITIGSYIHIAAYSSIIGKGDVVLSDFCNISSRVALYSSNDDYSGEFMTNPMVPDEYTNVSSGKVMICKHVIIGCGSVLLPNISIGEGVSIGALSLVKSNCEPFFTYAGNPLKKVKQKSRRLVDLELKLISPYSI